MDIATSSTREDIETVPSKRKIRKLVIPDMEEEEYYSPVKNENNNPNPKDESSEEKIADLSQFAFKKGGQSQRITRSASRKLQDQDPQLKSAEKTPTLDDIEELEKGLEEKEPRKKKVVSNKNKKKSDADNMPPPKQNARSSSSTKRKSDPSDNKKIKDELKERQIEEVSLYLFNYLKDTHTNTVNKISLKKCLRGLLIDNISEEQADIMLNYPHLETKDFQKDSLSLEDLKLLVRECSFKFGPDGNLL